MFEIYAECKSAIINNKCSECNEFYSCYICDFVEERYQQGRADAIDLIIELKNKYEHFSHEEYYVSAMVSDLEDLIEQLKEQNNG